MMFQWVEAAAEKTVLLHEWDLQHAFPARPDGTCTDIGGTLLNIQGAGNDL